MSERVRSDCHEQDTVGVKWAQQAKTDIRGRNIIKVAMATCIIIAVIMAAGTITVNNSPLSVVALFVEALFSVLLGVLLIILPGATVEHAQSFIRSKFEENGAPSKLYDYIFDYKNQYRIVEKAERFNRYHAYGKLDFDPKLFARKPKDFVEPGAMEAWKKKVGAAIDDYKAVCSIWAESISDWKQFESIMTDEDENLAAVEMLGNQLGIPEKIDAYLAGAAIEELMMNRADCDEPENVAAEDVPVEETAEEVCEGFETSDSDDVEKTREGEAVEDADGGDAQDGEDAAERAQEAPFARLYRIGMRILLATVVVCIVPAVIEGFGLKGNPVADASFSLACFIIGFGFTVGWIMVLIALLFGDSEEAENDGKSEAEGAVAPSGKDCGGISAGCAAVSVADRVAEMMSGELAPETSTVLSRISAQVEEAETKKVLVSSFTDDADVLASARNLASQVRENATIVLDSAYTGKDGKIVIALDSNACTIMGVSDELIETLGDMFKEVSGRKVSAAMEASTELREKAKAAIEALPPIVL